MEGRWRPGGFLDTLLFIVFFRFARGFMSQASENGGSVRFETEPLVEVANGELLTTNLTGQMIGQNS